MPEDKPDLVLAENPWLSSEQDDEPSADAAEQSAAATQDEIQAEEHDQPIAERRPTIELDPQDLYGSLRRLADSDPHFRNVLKSFSGRERQNELRAKVRELEKELEQLRYEKSLALIQSIPQEEIEKRYQTDSEFRQTYDYVANYAPPSDDETDYEELIEQVFDEGDGWLPPARVQQYLTAMAPGGCRCSAISEPHGIFDHDESGRPLSRVKAFTRFRDVFMSEVQAARQAYQSTRAQQFASYGAPAQQQAIQQPQATQQPVGQPVYQQQAQRPNRQNVAQAVEALRNPRLSANPDLSQGAPITGDEVLTKADIDRMSVEEMIRRWPNDGDFEKDVQAGKVLIPGINS